jgi:hypothetical protein
MAMLLASVGLHQSERNFAIALVPLGLDAKIKIRFMVACLALPNNLKQIVNWSWSLIA